PVTGRPGLKIMACACHRQAGRPSGLVDALVWSMKDGPNGDYQLDQSYAHIFMTYSSHYWIDNFGHFM
ncbi:unnamed protein product, partial [Rotaria socialis]